MTAIGFWLFGMSFIARTINDQLSERNKFITSVAENLTLAALCMFVIDITVWLWRVAP